MNVKKQAELFKVLGDERRLRMIQMLGCGPLCPGALAKGLKITAGAVSQHMRILKASGLVNSEKKGAFVHYTLNEKTLDKIQKATGLKIDYKKKVCSKVSCSQKKDIARNAPKCLKK